MQAAERAVSIVDLAHPAGQSVQLVKIWATNSKLLILKRLKSATHSVSRTADTPRSDVTTPNLSGHPLTQRTETAICFLPWG